MLSKRIIQALEVLGGDETQKGRTLREQASTYLGEDVDDATLEYIKSTAEIVYEDTFAKAEESDFPSHVAQMVSLANVMVSGMAIGKRLGIQDGERFAREVGNVDVTDA